MNELVLLVVTVCSLSSPNECESFAIESWQGVQAMQECTEYLESDGHKEHKIRRNGLVQTWYCERILPIDNQSELGE